jgi:hypothetical protein
VDEEEEGGPAPPAGVIFRLATSAREWELGFSWTMVVLLFCVGFSVSLIPRFEAVMSSSVPSLYEMPVVHLGQMVLWRHNPTAEVPAPAIVTRVGQRAVSVFIIPTESKVGITRDGVRHKGDPELAKIQSDAGCWEYTAFQTVPVGSPSAAKPAPLGVKSAESK